MQANPSFDLGSPAPRGLTQLGSFSLWFGVALIGVTVVYGAVGRSEAGQCLWGFLHIMRAMFAALLLACILNLRQARQRQYGSWTRALAPVFINLFTLCIIWLVPFDSLWQEAHFNLNQGRYATIVGWNAAGILTPDEAGWAPLPPGYERLSNTGLVQIAGAGTATTLYFPQSDLDGRPAGLFYRGDGYWPQPGELGLRCRQLRQLEPDWFAAEGLTVRQ